LLALTERESRLKTLFIKSLGGDTASYRTCLEETARLIRGFLRKRLSYIPDEVEDLVQEVLLAVHNQRHTFDTTQPFTVWVHAIARFKMIDFLRVRGRRGVHIEFDDAEHEQPVDENYAQDAKRDVLTLLDSLPDKQREAIQCVKIEGLTIAEAAIQTGQSESSIKVGIHRGLKALAEKMKGLV
jgi:RNA polymerase sigma-70 factor, ECF subfamily